MDITLFPKLCEWNASVLHSLLKKNPIPAVTEMVGEADCAHLNLHWKPQDQPKNETNWRWQQNKNNKINILTVTPTRELYKGQGDKHLCPIFFFSKRVALGDPTLLCVLKQSSVWAPQFLAFLCQMSITKQGNEITCPKLRIRPKARLWRDSCCLAVTALGVFLYGFACLRLCSWSLPLSTLHVLDLSAQVRMQHVSKTLGFVFLNRRTS